MICGKCKKNFPDSEIHLHHVHPKFMDNKIGDGMKINICEACHNKLHLIIPSLYWNLFTEKQKKEAIKRIISFSLKYGGLKK